MIFKKLFFSFVLSLSIFGLFSLTSVSADITSDLVSHWTLDDAVATDVVVDLNGLYDGVLNDCCTDTRSVPGFVDTAFSFNGSSDMVSIPTFPSMPSAMTASAWVYTSTSGAYKHILANWDSGASAVEYDFGLDTSNRLFFQGTSALIYSSSAVPVDTWTFVAFTRSVDDDIVLYVNGISVQTGSVSPSGSGYGETRIGQPGEYANQFFNGVIDDVIVYSRELSSSDIFDLYSVHSGEEPSLPTATSTNALLGSLNFGIGVLITLLFIIVIGFIFNSIDKKAKLRKW